MQKDQKTSRELKLFQSFYDLNLPEIIELKALIELYEMQIWSKNAFPGAGNVAQFIECSPSINIE